MQYLRHRVGFADSRNDFETRQEKSWVESGLLASFEEASNVPLHASHPSAPTCCDGNLLRVRVLPRPTTFLFTFPVEPGRTNGEHKFVLPKRCGE